MLLLGTGCGSSSHPATADVLVVGAGISGLAAARALRAKGYKVIVLEGRNRIGGRVWTKQLTTDIPIDMGASWIHGIKGNPIARLAHELKIRTIHSDYNDEQVYATSGKAISDSADNQIESRYQTVLKDMYAIRRERQRNYEPDISLQAAYGQVLTQLKPTPERKTQLDYSMNTEIEGDYAADLANLSLFHWDDDSVVENDDVIFPGGYSQIARGLAKGLRIELKQVVRRIEHDQKGVQITTDRGTFSAKQAVVTLPLAILKRGKVQFSPALPISKQAAIQKLGVGVLNKVYLHFPHVFWDRDVEFLGYISAAKGEWASWLSFYPYTGKPVLVAFNAARYGFAIERFSDAKIIADAMSVLQRIYGSSIPRPTAWAITRWAHDPFALGSYSHIPPGASGDDYDTLAEPVGEALFFAGEATTSSLPATVHGAFTTGLREAKRIAEL